MVFDSIKRALTGDDAERQPEAEKELARISEAVKRRADELEAKRKGRLDALFPKGPVEGAGSGRYPGLDPVNFEEGEPQSWLISTATGIIDNFPGAEALLSQLDDTYSAFANANHFRVVKGGPYDELLTWRDEIFDRWDLEVEVPIYVSSGAATEILGCKAPFLLIDRMTLDALSEDEQRFVLASSLGHVFFGNLRIFAFHRLMGVMDKLPSMTSLVTRGLGMIPGIGNTISRGYELARALNNQVIRKTNLVIGQRQHVLCDRLAALALGSQEAAQSYFRKTALGGVRAAEEGVLERMIEQGKIVHDQFEAGEIDLNMLSVVGPSASFACWRAYRLDHWTKDERAAKLAKGYYVTRERLTEHKKTDKALEGEIRFLEDRLVDLYKKETKLREELARMVQEGGKP